MAPKKASATSTGKAAAPTAADFNTGDIVLTKIKGYPDWPSKVGRACFVDDAHTAF